MNDIYDQRNFMIFDTVELDKIDFSEVLETSKDTVRKSIDGNLTFVKWDGETIPSSVQNLTTKSGPYSYDEMLEILKGANWSQNNL